MKLLARVSLLCNPGAFVTVKARLPLAIACFRHSVSWGPRGEGGGGGWHLREVWVGVWHQVLQILIHLFKTRPFFMTLIEGAAQL